MITCDFKVCKINESISFVDYFKLRVLILEWVRGDTEPLYSLVSRVLRIYWTLIIHKVELRIELTKLNKADYIFLNKSYLVRFYLENWHIELYKKQSKILLAQFPKQFLVKSLNNVYFISLFFTFPILTKKKLISILAPIRMLSRIITKFQNHP